MVYLITVNGNLYSTICGPVYVLNITGDIRVWIIYKMAVTIYGMVFKSCYKYCKGFRANMPSVNHP